MKILIPADHLCVIKGDKMSGLDLDLLAGNCFDGLTVDRENETVSFDFESDVRTYSYDNIKVVEVTEPDLEGLSEEDLISSNYEVNVLGVRELKESDLDGITELLTDTKYRNSVN